MYAVRSKALTGQNDGNGFLIIYICNLMLPRSYSLNIRFFFFLEYEMRFSLQSIFIYLFYY